VVENFIFLLFFGKKKKRIEKRKNEVRKEGRMREKKDFFQAVR
jgi:hypothetical protein